MGDLTIAETIVMLEDYIVRLKRAAEEIGRDAKCRIACGIESVNLYNTKIYTGVDISKRDGKPSFSDGICYFEIGREKEV